jgi:hypothetical protein
MDLEPVEQSGLFWIHDYWTKTFTHFVVRHRDVHWEFGHTPNTLVTSVRGGCWTTVTRDEDVSARPAVITNSNRFNSFLTTQLRNSETNSACTGES